MNPCAYLLFKNKRSCDHRNIMILYQGFPNWGVPLVICKPLKSGTRAALCQEQGGGRSWFSADLEETGKGCLGSECCRKCQMLPLWLFLALHQGAAAAFLEEGGEQRDGSAHSHTHTVHSHTRTTQCPSPPGSLEPRAPCLGHLSCWTLLSPEQVSLHPSLAAALQPWGSQSTMGHCWAAAPHWQPAPRKNKFGKPCTTAKLKKQLEVPQGEWDIPTRMIWWRGDTSGISFGFV